MVLKYCLAFAAAFISPNVAVPALSFTVDIGVAIVAATVGAVVTFTVFTVVIGDWAGTGDGVVG